MESILKQITNSLEGNLKCKTIKSETISYEIDYEVKKEIRSKTFDFVIRDLEGEIVAIGDYIPKNSDVAGFQNLINGEASGISYPVFYVNEGGWFILVNGSSVDLELDLDDWLYAEEFCPFLQSKHPSTKRDIDFYTENLNKEIESLKDSLADANLEIQKLKEDNTLQSENNYQKEQLEKLEIKINKYIKTDKTKTISAISNCLFIKELKEAISNIKLPERKDNQTDKKYGRAYNEKYSAVYSTDNSSSEFLLGNISDKFYLLLQTYKWNAELAGEYPSTKFYFYYDEINKHFTPDNGNEVEDILTWIPLKDF